VLVRRVLVVFDPSLLHLHGPLLVSDGAPAAKLPGRPRLAPGHRVVPDRGRCLVEKGGTVVTLEGRAAERFLPRLLTLLDGTRTLDELAAELGDPSAPAIEHALSLLASHRLLVDGVDGLGDTSERLAQASVTVAGSGAGAEEVARMLADAGVGRATVRPFDAAPDGDAFVVAVPSPVEVPLLDARNRLALEQRVSWLQLLPFDGRFSVVGPLFLPDESACRTCFVTRRASCSGFDEDFELVESEPVRATPPVPLTFLAASLAAFLVHRWLTSGDPTLPGRLYAVESATVLRLTHERVLRVPRCPDCGPPRQAVASPWFELTA
jgi:bacteriocin biosynthesis cyclodehydratase domain-containing protein